MLWKGYKLVIIGGVLLIALLVWAGYQVFGRIQPDAPMIWWRAILYTLVAAAVIFMAIRGTLSHRPINPSTVAYCGDGMLNTLPLNSLYSVLYAIYSIKNERSASDVYGNLPDEELSQEINRFADIPAAGGNIPSLHIQTPGRTRTRPLNIVMIVEESLGAQYVGNLGDRKS